MLVALRPVQGYSCRAFKMEPPLPETEHYQVDQLLQLACRILKISPDEVLRRARLPARNLSSKDKGVTAEQYFVLWTATEACYGKRNMAQKLGIALAHGPFVPAFFAFSCSPDIRAGIERLALFKPLVGPVELITDVQDDSFEVQIRPNKPSLHMSPTHAYYEAVLFLELCRTHTATQIRPLEVGLPDPAIADQSYLGVEPHRQAVTILKTSRDDAQLPLVSENADMWSVFEPELRRKLAEKMAVSGVQERLRNALLQTVPGGVTNSEKLATMLHMSKRSLQRSLREEGTTYQKVLDDTRADLARHYLIQTNTPLAQVSFLLGYSSQASFFRAFSSWFGTTPSSYRSANRTRGRPARGDIAS